ncbi:hypothetical protein [Okeania sp.]|uniref:hypothetical protein n=1 Tax=Okeania sp. TaxID=3100323 RepID=UPI002B4B8D16|nr:hypothetical protein [Okeania sp.]MEB3342880.1 hypothetical protein [Okeania sp.]
MNQKLLIDTDVLIDYLRSNSQAVNFLESLTQLLFISSMTVAELYTGVREEKVKNLFSSILKEKVRKSKCH